MTHVRNRTEFSSTDVLPITFPGRGDVALPVIALDPAVAFYRSVFDMEQGDAAADPPYALLRRGPFQLALYEVPGYASRKTSVPAFSVTLDAREFDALRARVLLHGGTITRDVVRGEPIPRFLFSDPGACTLIECRGRVHLEPL